MFCFRNLYYNFSAHVLPVNKNTKPCGEVHAVVLLRQPNDGAGSGALPMETDKLAGMLAELEEEDVVPGLTALYSYLTLFQPPSVRRIRPGNIKGHRTRQHQVWAKTLLHLHLIFVQV